MLDKLLLLKDMHEPLEVFAVVNSTMDQAVAVDLLLSVFDYAQCETLASALTAEIARRRALEIEQKDRVKAVRRKVGRNAN